MPVPPVIRPVRLLKPATPEGGMIQKWKTSPGGTVRITGKELQYIYRMKTIREHEHAAQSKSKAKPPRPQPSMKTGLRAPGPRPSKKGDDDADAQKCHMPSLLDRL